MALARPGAALDDLRALLAFGHDGPLGLAAAADARLLLHINPHGHVRGSAVLAGA